MAYTLLQAINLVLKRVGTVAGDSTAITSLTDQQKQRDIDVCIEVWNEAVRTIYDYADLKGTEAQTSITLVTSQREYDWAADFEKMAGESPEQQVFICQSNNLQIVPYPGGYQAMFQAQPNPNFWNGLPYHWADNQVTGKIRLDYTPTASENGLIYTYNYIKRLNLSSASDTFPFSDSVVDHLVAPVSEVYRLQVKENLRQPVYAAQGFSIALRFALRRNPRRQYGIYRPKSVFGWRGPFEP